MRALAGMRSQVSSRRIFGVYGHGEWTRSRDGVDLYPSGFLSRMQSNRPAVRNGNLQLRDHLVHLDRTVVNHHRSLHHREQLEP